MPAFDGCDDFIWVFGPDERFWVSVGLGEEAVDGGLKLGNGFEDAALQPPSGQLGKITLHSVEPRTRGRGEVEGEALVPCEPSQNLWVLVRDIIVENDVDGLLGRHFRLDRVEETDELLMPMSLHAASDDLAFEHIEGGKERRGAVALVVVGHGTGPALLHGKFRLGTVERLDLALLVDG